jgi:transcriptional regulator with XRE-family HTH domain
VTGEAGGEPFKLLGEFIRAQRRLANLSLRQMSAAAHVSNPYLSQIERGLYRPSAQVLKSIADALHISADSLYEQVGWLDADEAPRDEVGVEAAIRLDPQLTTEQKEVLIRVYRSFTAAP